jgi:hypothetical protein
MPILIVQCDPDQCGIPAVICDACGQPIERADEGNFHWRTSAEVEGAVPYFSHQSDCCATVDHHFDTENCLGLDDLLLCLSVNLGFDFKKTMAKEQYYPSFVWGKPRRKR